MSIEIINLPKSLYDEAKSLGIEIIELNFSGGSDEGYLSVNVTPFNEDFENKIEEWADDAYSYSGAGCGSDYGDDIVYDLKENKVTCSEWYTERVNGDPQELSLEVDETEE